MRRLAAGLVLTLAGVAPLDAQTNDHLFRSWSFAVGAPSPRSAALGGALDACADDASGVQTNPAAISTLHKAEILAAGGLRTERDGALGDVLGARLGLAFVGGAVHFSPRLAAGAYLAQPHSMEVRLAPTELPDGLHDDGSIDTNVTELGGAVAWQVSERLHLGARLSARHLSVEGRYSREPVQGTTNLRVGTSSSTTAPAGAIGLLLRPVPSLRVGLVAESGSGWRAQRTATSPLLGVVLDEDGEYEIRQPSRLTAGLAWRTSPRLTLFASLDRVWLGEVQGRLAIAQGAYARADYALDDAWEGGAGGELSLAFRRLGLQIRAGVRSAPSAMLRYQGADAVALAAFPGSDRRTVFGAGAGVFTRGGLHVDVSVRAGDGLSALAGAGFRF